MVSACAALRSANERLAYDLSSIIHVSSEAVVVLGDQRSDVRHRSPAPEEPVDGVPLLRI